MPSFMTRMAALVAAGILGTAPMVASAQSAQGTTAIASSSVPSQIPMFNYRNGRKSDLLLQATGVVDRAEGEVKVEFEEGIAEISAEVKRLPEPTTLGPYTNYVLWTLTPEGQYTNEGVIAGIEGDDGELVVRHGGSQFAILVTAEPHFAVSTPSTMVVLYNVADNVRGQETRITRLPEHTDYSTLRPIAIDERTNPVELVQAEYAVTIAEAAGAEEYASGPFMGAEQRLAAARAALSSRRNSERKTAPDIARTAVTSAEDARRTALVARAAAEEEQRRADAAAQAAAAAAAQVAAVERAAIERERAAAERAAAERAAAERERDRAAAERAAAERERQRAESERVAAEREAALDAARRAEAAAARAAASAEAARQDLLNRLNYALPTRESDRGLISEIGGVQFATGTAQLNGSARESLARFSGIVASYPDLQFVIEGHTDSTGSDATNRELSLHRAMAVRDYLITHGIGASRIDVRGYGAERPVAENSTAQGRARNRRVEIVISGGLLASR